MGDGSVRTLVAAAVINLAVGTLFAWSILQPPLRGEFGAELDQLSAIFSAALLVFAGVVLAAGKLTDRHSPRLLAALAGVAAGVGLALAAAAPSLAVVAGGFGVLFGLASGLGYVTVVTVAATRFGARRGMAVSVVVGAYAAGPILAGPLGTIAIQAWGWRAFLMLLASAVSVLTLAASPWLPSRPARDGERGGGRVPRSARAGLWALWTLFLCATMPGLAAFTFATDIVVERGLSIVAAGAVVATMGAGNLIGRLAAGPVSDRVGTQATMRSNVALLATAVAALGWGAGGLAAVLALPLIGLQYGAISALLPGATNDLVGDAGFGAAYGRAFSSWGIAGVLGPAAGAWLHQQSGGYALAFRLSLVAAAVAWVVLIRLRGPTPDDQRGRHAHDAGVPAPRDRHERA